MTARDNSVYKVLAVLGIGAFSMSVVQPVLPLYLARIGISPELIGLMFSAAMISMAFGESFWGWIADKTGTWIPLFIGTFVSGLTVISFAFAGSVSLLFLIFFAWGWCRSALFGPGRGIIGASAPAAKKATFLAFIAAVMAGSRTLGALPSGFMADLWGYPVVFLCGGGIALLGGIVVIIFIRSVKRAENHNGQDRARAEGDEENHEGERLKLRPLSVQCLVTSLQFFSLGIIFAFFPLLATRVVGTSVTQVGLLFTITGITAMVLSVPMGMLADRAGKKKIMVCGLLVSAAAMAAIAHANSFGGLVAAAMGNSLGFALFGPAALGLLSSSVPRHLQSTAMGLYGGVCENSGIILGSALAGFAWNLWGPKFTFLMGTMASVSGAVVCLFFLSDLSSCVCSRGVVQE